VNGSSLMAWAFEQRMTVSDMLHTASYHPAIEGTLKAALSQLHHRHHYLAMDTTC
jgi:hypothetical protein